MRLIDADAFRQRMYHEAFETDTDMQKWDSGCWIRYKLFENCIDELPTLSPDEVRGVVKCKDCTFGESATDGDGNPCVLCGNSMVFDYPYAHDPDWFCADGEMKGAEDGTTDNS